MITFDRGLTRSNLRPVHLYGENLEKSRLMAETYNV